jgi:hypothetical protein
MAMFESQGYRDGYQSVYIPLTLTLSRKGRGKLRVLPSLDGRGIRGG